MIRPIGLEDYVRNMVAVAKPGFDAGSADARDVGLEGSITAFVRLALMYWPGARVANLLRELAEAIESG